MEHHLLGQTFALLAAITWALALVLFKRSGETVSPLALNLFKNAIGIILIGFTLTVMGAGLAVLRNHHPGDLCILMLSGVIGIALADTVFFYALNLIGVGLFSIVDCLYSPLVVLFSWLLLFEELSLYHYLGGALILAGVFVSCRHPPPPDRTRAQLVVGILLATVAVVMMALSIVIAKPVLEGFPVIWATMLRLLPGSLVLALITLLMPKRKAIWLVFKPCAVWKVSIPGAILGTYLAMIFWVAGFTFTDASIAALLNQTSVVFAVILATIFLKEHFTRRKLTAMVLALSGVALVMLQNRLSALW